MVSTVVTVINEEGLHMRPAGALARLAASFDNCKITLIYNGVCTDAKSVMQVMMAGINCGAMLTVEVEGENENQVLGKLADAFARGFI